MDRKEKNKNSSLWIKILIYAFWIYILIIIINILIDFYIPSDKDITFVIPSEQPWISCYNDVSSITINYDLSSSSAVDLIFTPTQEDAGKYIAISWGLANLSENYQYPQNYASCRISNVLKNKGSCVIAGKGCMLLLNKNTNDATISLKYSARTIED